MDHRRSRRRFQVQFQNPCLHRSPCPDLSRRRRRRRVRDYPDRGCWPARRPCPWYLLAPERPEPPLLAAALAAPVEVVPPALRPARAQAAAVFSLAPARAAALSSAAAAAPGFSAAMPPSSSREEEAPAA